METAHKFLAFKNAMNNNYKMNNFITAAHFARLVLDLEPTGVPTLQSNLLDLPVKTRSYPSIQKVLPGIPAEGYECIKVKFRELFER
jgi:Coatomer (COPI) alpha subunit C-terminus